MRQLSFILPRDENVEVGTLPPGTYRVTVTGLTSEGIVSVEPRNSANTGWVAATTFNRTDSGRIGSRTVVINANGRVRCSISGDIEPTGVKVRISA
jgi:hypothetical protein